MTPTMEMRYRTLHPAIYFFPLKSSTKGILWIQRTHLIRCLSKCTENVQTIIAKKFISQFGTVLEYK